MRSPIPAVPALAALILAAGICAGQGTGPKAGSADASKDFEVKDDFEDGNLKPFGQGDWMAFDDKNDGGASTAKVEVAAREDGKGKCLEFAFSLGKAFPKKDGSGEDNPRAYAALSLGKAPFKGWQDLSAFSGLSFEACGEGEFVMVLFTFRNEAMRIHYHSFAAAKEWKKHTFDFEDFLPIETLKGDLENSEEFRMNLQSAMLLAAGTGFKAKPGSEGKLRMDDFRFLKKSKAERIKDLQETEKVMFGEIEILKPKQFWIWKDSELKNPGKAVSMYFASFPMVNDWRVPFPGGRFADPSNVKEMERCTVLELERRGLKNINRRTSQKVGLSQFKSHRFTFDAEVSSELLKIFRAMGFESPAIFVQVDFIKYRSVMYEIITLAHSQTAEEQMPTVLYMLHNLRKWQK